MEAKWMVSGDWGETGLTSNRYNMAGLNRNGSKQSITYGNYGVPLYLVMPTGTAHDPYIVHSYEASGGVGYNPNALVTAGSNKYYMAKMGQRKAELSAGNALPAGQNQALTSGDSPKRSGRDHALRKCRRSSHGGVHGQNFHQRQVHDCGLLFLWS